MSSILAAADPSLRRTSTASPTLIPDTDVTALPSGPIIIPYPRSRTLLGFSDSRPAGAALSLASANALRDSAACGAQVDARSAADLLASILLRPDSGDSRASMTLNLDSIPAILSDIARSALPQSSSSPILLMSRSLMAPDGDSLASTTSNLDLMRSRTDESALPALAESEPTWELISALSLSMMAAAPVGVGARRSATKSAIVKSVSCPTAETPGTAEAAIARATLSSLNGQRSSREPPPLATTITSTLTRFRSPMPATMVSAAPSPWTCAGASSMSAGNLDADVVIMSCMTAPVSDVTTPIVLG